MEAGSLAFRSEDPKLRYGYPYVLAEQTLACTTTFDGNENAHHEGGYTPATINISGLMADIGIWAGTTIVPAVAIIGIRRSYRNGGWAKTTKPIVYCTIFATGLLITGLVALPPHKSNPDGLYCYDNHISDNAIKELPYKHGYPLSFYTNSVSCGNYRWVAPYAYDVCGGNCTDYTDPAHIYYWALALDIATGQTVAILGYSLVRLARKKY